MANEGLRVLVTGAAGFIGAELVRQLLASGLGDGRADGPAGAPVAELIAADLQRPQAPWVDDRRVHLALGDVSQPDGLAAALGAAHGAAHGARGQVDSIFALGATLTHAAEHDLAHGLQVNLQGMLHLLQACRAMPRAPRLVYTSSIAAFGGALPETVDDEVAPAPQTSYGTHKAVNELLIADHTRRGHVDGRVLRLPIVLVRPAVPAPVLDGASGTSGTAAPAAPVSERVAALVREPLAGRDVACPLAPGTRMPVASVQAVARALRHLHDLPAAALAGVRALNLPSLSVTAAELAAAVQAVPARRGDVRHPLGHIGWLPEPALQAIVDGWPRRFTSARALALGLRADTDLDMLIDHYLDGLTVDGLAAAQR